MICLRVSLSSLESIHLFYYSLATRVSRDLTPWLVRQYARWPMRRDRDLTVKGSRHLTFHITVKLTIKEEMLNLTCRQTFSFTQARPDSVWQLGAHAVEEAADAAHSTQVERAALHASAAQDMAYAAERAVCACLKRLVSEASVRAARER